LRDAAALTLGVYSRIDAVALALFVAFVSLAFVQFWSIERPADARVMVRNLFIGNVAIVSGLLYVAVAGAASLRSSTSSDPDRLPEIRQEVYPEQSGSKSDRNQGKDGETTVPYARLSTDNAAVPFVDHQTGLANGVQTQTPASWRRLNP
jgi:hypothetical protein